MPRVDFSESTKRIIAGRAGYRCSFPTCGRNTIGPGANLHDVSVTGIAAHIYSASAGGPRGQGGLTEEELAQPENGIWLCSECARKVDNNDGGRFSSNSLLSYKNLHETRILREHQGLYTPIGWLYEIKIGKNPVFRANQSIKFAKLNLFIGANGTGKTAVLDWLSVAFGNPIEDWNRVNYEKTQIELAYLNPEDQAISMTTDGQGNTYFKVNDECVGMNPILMRTIRPTELERNRIDDRDRLAHCLGIRSCDVDGLIAEIHRFPHSHIRKARFEPDPTSNEADEDAESTSCGGDQVNRLVLRLDLTGTVPGLSLMQLSGGECVIVIVEFAAALARISGRYAPTLLMLDCLVRCMTLDEWVQRFYHHLADPSNQFQTFLCAPDGGLEHTESRWQGWEVIRTHGQAPECEITQKPRIETPAS